MNYSYSPDTAKVLLSILLGSIGLFLLLAISSYSPFDPGWTYTSSDTVRVSNLGGMVGAWFADLLRAGLGWASFFVPFYLFYEIWQLWKPRTVLPRVWRYFAQTFMIVMLASLFALFRSQHSLNYAGGVIGYEVSFAISNIFTVYGAGLLFILFFVLACNLIFVINWHKIWFNIKLAIDFIKDTLYRSQDKVATSTATNHQANTEHTHDTIHLNTATQNADFSTDTPHHTQEHSAQNHQDIHSEQVHIHTANVYVTGEVGQRADTAQTHLFEIQQLLAQSKAQRAQAVKEVEQQPTVIIQTTQSHDNHKPNQQAFDDLLHRLDEQIQVSSNHVHQKADTQDIDRRIHELHQQIEALQQAQSDILQQKQHGEQLNTAQYQSNIASHHSMQDERLNEPAVTQTQHSVPNIEPETQHQTINLAKIQQQTAEQTTSNPPSEEPKKESKIQNLLDKVLARRSKEQAETQTLSSTESIKYGENTNSSITTSSVDEPDFATASAPTVNMQALDNEFLLQHQQLQQRLKHNPLQDLEQMLMLADASKQKKSTTHLKSGHIEQKQQDNSNDFSFDIQQDDDFSIKQTAVDTVSSVSLSDNYSQNSDNIRERIRSQLNHLETETSTTPYQQNITSGHDFDDDDDWDAPLTDAHGRIVSRAMQVAQHRKNLSPLPSLDLLDKVDVNKKVSFSEEQLGYLSQLLELKLQDFNVKAQVKEVQPGPVVTRFALELAPGVKASKVTGIAQDLARSMSMSSIRVVQVIPGKPYIGIEVPNSTREMVRLIELVDTPDFRDPNALLSMAMGKDISGQPVLTDLAKAPHMLVAGTTGSGKSVAVNSMLLSMLLKYTPQQLRLLLIDPKQLELANYDEIPHLLTPVVTDMKDATNALHWCVKEMERRYSLMTAFKVRKINDFNAKITQAIENGEDIIDPLWKPDNSVMERAPRLQPLPMIVIVADEFADMIMQVGKKAEEMITRLAQKSRAAGIHLLLATQRPSVDVITGLIKANIPTRVALRVNSKIDSRTILDAGGAEDLLGHGDMLFLAPGKNEPERLHGAFIADDEVNRICDAWRERGSPDYVADILDSDEDEEKSSNADFDDGQIQDVLYDKAVEFVLRTRKASASALQRQFNIGFNRAANLMDAMERNGIVSESQGSNRRDILI